MKTLNYKNNRTNGDESIDYTIPENLERRLPAEVKERWLKDLRSGEFKQGYDVLCKVDAEGKPATYCCLGVLVKDKLTPPSEEEGHAPHYDPGSFTFSPDQPEFRWLGDGGNIPVIVTRVCRITGDVIGHIGTLTVLNDFGVPFDVIAQIIEDLL